MMASSRSGGGGHHHGRSGQSSPMTRCGKCCYYCRQVTTFLFSHIGLCTLLLGYALIGAFTFQALESQHEHEQRLDMIRTRNDMILELSNMTNHSIFLNREIWIQNATAILGRFEKKYLHAVRFKGYDGSDEMSKTQWSFSGALLYSIIVITTIGYGNVAPRTDMGKIVTILYAIIGIPLMLFCLSNIGHAMAHSFKFIYWKCCCFLCVKPKKLQRRQRRRRRLMLRQQRQRAMMALTQQPTSTILENNANVGGGTQMPLTSLANHLSRTFSERSPTHFRFPPIQLSNVNATNQSGQLTEPSSSFTNTPSLTPLALNNGPAFFPNNPPAQEPASGPSATNSMRPKKSNLSRSASARYHNEQHSLPNYQHQLSAQTDNQASASGTSGTGNNTVKSSKDKVTVPAIICNKYASLSDECIDAYRAMRAAEAQIQQGRGHNASPQRNAPRRTPSQVRFQQQPLPNLSVIAPSPEHEQIPPPPPFPYPTTSDDNNNNSNQAPPPPFQSSSNYYNGTIENSIPIYDQNGQYIGNHTPSYNYGNQLNQYILNKDDLDSDLDSDSDDENVTKKNIPITVCLTLVVGYICGGAWFFSTSEEWSFLDASYFCFVTLSTIGFGDLVPGRTVLASSPEEGQMTLAICALYLLFGMALLAMSLNLVKEKVTQTVRIIGERIGILVNDDDDDYY